MKRILYIYTTESDRRLGRYKFGQTKREAKQRVKEQDSTSNSEPLILVFSIESYLTDHQVHDMLELEGKKRTRDNREWFESFQDDEDAIYFLNLIISKSDNYLMRQVLYKQASLSMKANLKKINDNY